MRRTHLVIGTGLFLAVGAVAVAATIGQPGSTGGLVLFSTSKGAGSSANVTVSGTGTGEYVTLTENAALYSANTIWYRATRSEWGMGQFQADLGKDTNALPTAWGATDGCINDTVSDGYVDGDGSHAGLLLVNGTEYRVGPGKPAAGVYTQATGITFTAPTAADPIAFRFLTGPTYGKVGDDSYTVTFTFDNDTTSVATIPIQDENAITVADRAGSHTSAPPGAEAEWDVITSNNGAGTIVTYGKEGSQPAETCVGAFIDEVIVTPPTDVTSPIKSVSIAYTNAGNTDLRGPIAVAYEFANGTAYDAMFPSYVGTYMTADGSLKAEGTGTKNGIWYGFAWTENLTDAGTPSRGDLTLDLYCGDGTLAGSDFIGTFSSKPSLGDTPTPAPNPPGHELVLANTNDPSTTFCYGPEIYYEAELVSWFKTSPRLTGMTFRFALDNDGDHYGAEAIDLSGTDNDFPIDCDDADAARFPGNPEIADGKDNDCDGEKDEGTNQYDADGDCYCLSATCSDSINPCAGGLNPAGKVDCVDSGTVDGFTAFNINPGVKDICGNNVNEDLTGGENGGGEDCDPNGATYKTDATTVIGAAGTDRQLDEDADTVADSSESPGDAAEPDMCDKDTDNDGINDNIEIAQGYDPLDADDDDDGLSDGAEDTDDNGPEADETLVTDADTDNDTIKDGVELGDTTAVSSGTSEGPSTPIDTRKTYGGSSGFVADADPSTTTNPLDPDSDNDGLCDGDRSGASATPTDSCDDAGRHDDGEDANADGEYDPGNVHGAATAADETNAVTQDSDGDGICDHNGSPTGCVGSEFAYVATLNGLRGWDSDSDDDGLSDGAEDLDDDGVFEANEPIPDDPNSDTDSLCDGTRPAGTVYPADACDDGGTTPNEATIGTDPTQPDTDHDGLSDSNEAPGGGVDPLDADTDNDGYKDGDETGGLLATDSDTDNDGIVDGVETDKAAIPAVAAGSNNGYAYGGSGTYPDGADVTDNARKTNPLNVDTDGDGLCDGGGNPGGCTTGEDMDNDGRVDTGGSPAVPTESNPNDADSDEDGISDGAEVTDPINKLDWDTDDDALPDGLEMGQSTPVASGGTAPYTYLGTVQCTGNVRVPAEFPCFWSDGGTPAHDSDPTDPDSDGDGICDAVRADSDPQTEATEINPTDTCTGGEDRDFDGVVDTGESSPKDADSDDDRIADKAEDLDGDGTRDTNETSARNPDTDGDGLPDGQETGKTVAIGGGNSASTDPQVEITFVGTEGSVEFDGDSVTDSDPLDVDSDGDNLCDGTGTITSDAGFGTCTTAGGEDTSTNGIVDTGESDPLDVDSDNDGYRDDLETGGLIKTDSDTDNDGLVDGVETDKPALTGGTSVSGFTIDGSGSYPNGADVTDANTKTNPLSVDTDGDGLCDGGGNPGGCTTGEDMDNDGRVDTGGSPAVPSESNPVDADSDEDGISDGSEVTDPINKLDWDTDDDGLPDGVEMGKSAGVASGGTTFPFAGTITCTTGLPNPAPLPCFYADGTTASHDSDPTDPDSDNDGICDAVRADNDAQAETPEINPTDACTGGEDRDFDGVVDTGESSPKDADSDDDRVADKAEDLNGDGTRQTAETSPRNPDTDGDGLPDGQETGKTALISGGNSGSSDAEVEVLFTGTDAAAGVEFDADSNAGSDPADADSDGDGLCDGATAVDNAFGTCSAGEDTDSDGQDADVFVPPSGSGTESDPLDADSDDDGIDDSDEGAGSVLVATGITITFTATGKLDADSDDDGLDDGTEIGKNTDVATPASLGGLTPAGTAAAWAGDSNPPTAGGTAGVVPNTTNPAHCDTDLDGICDGPRGASPTPAAPSTPRTVAGCNNGFAPGGAQFGGEDSDKDGAVDATETDPRDDDSDNDALLDGTEEIHGCNGTTTSDPANCLNPLDSDSDNDNVLDDDEMLAVCPGSVPDGTLTDPANCDEDYPTADNNTTINGLDVDDDNDLVNTVFEDWSIGTGGTKGAGNSNPLDDNLDSALPNGDNVPDYLDVDDDADGIQSRLEDNSTNGCGNNNGNPRDEDTDGDSWPDYIDPDDDGDFDPAFRTAVGATGIQYIAATAHENAGAALTDHCDPDTDDDGIVDGTEFGATPATPRNADGDGSIDAKDEDDDNDGLLTAVEDDGSGLFNIDAVEFSNATKTCLTDLIPNYLDRDSDNDGVCDGIATTGGTLGAPACQDWHLVDRDGAGLEFPDQPPLDQDEDLIPNQWDCDDLDGVGVDSDLDGPLTKAEYGLCRTGACPDDVDGVCVPEGQTCTVTKCCLNPFNADTDGDCVNDGDELSALFALIDTDGDLVEDALDRDDDDDNVPTYLEYYDLAAGEFQFDDAGVLRIDPVGCDPTTINTSYIGPNDMDTDGDGTPDFRDDDDDGDGIATIDEDADGDDDPTNDDNDDDKLPDYLDAIADGPCGDLDGDGINNDIEDDLGLSRDTIDSDGDGVLDNEELWGAGEDCAAPHSRPVDFDPLLECDAVTSFAGACLALDCCGAPPNLDGDSLVDALDADDDGDGLDTKVEGTFDQDGDGTPNYLDTDSDGDTLTDANEGLNDADADGTPDFLDTEADVIGPPTDPDPGDEPPSCKCTSAPTPTMGVWGVLLGLALVARRRRAA